jgi:hypothetical protein
LAKLTIKKANPKGWLSLLLVKVLSFSEKTFEGNA